jgi:hypothetical protein
MRVTTDRVEALNTAGIRSLATSQLLCPIDVFNNALSISYIFRTKDAPTFRKKDLLFYPEKVIAAFLGADGRP